MRFSAADAEDGEPDSFDHQEVVVVGLAGRLDGRRPELLDDLEGDLLGDDPRHSALPG